MNNTVAIICSKMQNLKHIFQSKFEENVNWVMCHVFSPSRAVLSAILRDEYLTSAVRTREGDKAGSNQPPARDPVQFKLKLMPNYLISYLSFFSSNRRGQIFISQNSA